MQRICWQAIRSGSQGLDRSVQLRRFREYYEHEEWDTGQFQYLFKAEHPAIITLLSTPKSSIGGNVTNIVTARLRAITGNALEKPPANLGDRDFHFSLPGDLRNHPLHWRLRQRNEWTDPIRFRSDGVSLQIISLSYAWRFQWPVLPNGQTGRNRRVFRTSFDGHSMTNKLGLYYSAFNVLS
jgi:hypothetical protein